MITDDPMLMAELAAAKREEQDAAWRGRQRIPGHGPLSSALILDTSEDSLAGRYRWHAEYHGGRFEACPAPTCSGEVPA